MDYCWPGNVRELENAIEHAFVTCRAETIERADLPIEIRSAAHREAECRERGGGPATAAGTTGRLTREALLSMLQSCHWNQSETARRLHVDRTTVWRKMKQWDIKAAGGTGRRTQARDG